MPARPTSPCWSPRISQECQDFTKLRLSAERGATTPRCFCALTTRIAHARSLVEIGERAEAPLRALREGRQQIRHDAGHGASKRHVAVEERDGSAWRKDGETLPINAMQDAARRRIGHHHQRRVLSICARKPCPRPAIFKLGMVYPLPMELHPRTFARTVDRLVVVEELEPFIETRDRRLRASPARARSLHRLQGELTPPDRVRRVLVRVRTMPKVRGRIHPGRPPVLCPGCPHRGAVLCAQQAEA